MCLYMCVYGIFLHDFSMIWYMNWCVQKHIECQVSTNMKAMDTHHQSINQSNVNITYNLQIYHTMSNNGCPSPTTVNLTTDEILSNLRAKTRKGGTLWMWSRTFRNINWYRYLNIYIYYIDNYVRTYVRLCMYVCMYIDNYVSVCVYI